MNYPISERQRLCILERLQGIRIVSGFNQDLEVEAYKRGGQGTVGDLVGILSFDDDLQNTESPIGYESWIRPYKLLVQVFGDDGSKTYEQRVNAVHADLCTVVMRDVTWDNTSQNTFIVPPQRFDDANDITGILFRFNVHWRHLDGNPFQH